MSATLSFSPSFAVVSRDTAFDHFVDNPPGVMSGNDANFDVAPDGRSIVYLSGGTSLADVTVIHDGKQELRARMGAARKR